MLNKTGYCDFHCHLDDDCFEQNRWQIIDQCFSQGFAGMITVADPFKILSLEKTEEILACHSDIYAVCGAHPHQADQYSLEIEKNIFAFLAKEKAVAVGEVGLDFHYNFATRENQIKVLQRQIAIARELTLPLVIHSRNAEAEVLQILAAENFALPVVFHCFTGNMAAAEEILHRGFSISISGIVTFKKADALREIVKIIPLPQLFSETDSPYLAPEPKRGEINTPLGVLRVVEKIAAIKNMDATQINTAIAQNFLRLLAKN
jgi:TatD DNase family protein